MPDLYANNIGVMKLHLLKKDQFIPHCEIIINVCGSPFLTNLNPHELVAMTCKCIVFCNEPAKLHTKLPGCHHAQVKI